jgi:hypothetical protein
MYCNINPNCKSVGNHLFTSGITCSDVHFAYDLTTVNFISPENALQAL